MMYDDLIKQLCYCADATTCRNCLWKTEWCPTDMQKKAADAIEELRKAVLRLEDESGIYDELPIVYIYPTKWIPVTERLPEENALCLVYNKYYGPMVGWRVDGKRFRIPGSHFPDHPTHWMQLPEPPKDGE